MFYSLINCQANKERCRVQDRHKSRVKDRPIIISRLYKFFSNYCIILNNVHKSNFPPKTPASNKLMLCMYMPKNIAQSKNKKHCSMFVLNHPVLSITYLYTVINSLANHSSNKFTCLTRSRWPPPWHDCTKTSYRRCKANSWLQQRYINAKFCIYQGHNNCKARLRPWYVSNRNSYRQDKQAIEPCNRKNKQSRWKLGQNLDQTTSEPSPGIEPMTRSQWCRRLFTLPLCHGHTSTIYQINDYTNSRLKENTGTQQPENKVHLVKGYKPKTNRTTKAFNNTIITQKSDAYEETTYRYISRHSLQTDTVDGAPKMNPPAA